MATLPLKSSIDAWNEAVSIHAARFARPVSHVLRMVSLCKNKVFLVDMLGRSLCKNEGKIKNKDEIADAMLSSCGRKYFSIIRKYDRCESIVAARPQLIITLVKEIIETFGRRFYTGTEFVLCNQFLKALFDYNSFAEGKVIKIKFGHENKVWWGMSQDAPRWDASMLIRKMGIRYCPYCNAETIYVIPKCDNESNCSEDICYHTALDHFLPKDRYPFLGLSLYNLVPSCTRCNTSYKHNKDPISLWQCDVLPRDGHDVDIFRAAHPYIENVYDNFTMRFVLRNGELALEYKANVREALCRSRVLMESMFRWSQTYTELFMPEALAVAGNIQKIRPVYMQMLKKAYGKLPVLSMERVVCGFDIDQEDFMNHRLGKLKVDLFNKHVRNHKALWRVTKYP